MDPGERGKHAARREAGDKTGLSVRIISVEYAAKMYHLGCYGQLVPPAAGQPPRNPEQGTRGTGSSQ